ncbi:sugar ABC transporter permease [Paenibacillus rhizovicinus]|uniref:Sugar ABC transporter permease n=1 Tax=Paenibacillus rhizovicinus TaxID=2704463 RepID=A0A6C0P7H9_9BACL|nr:ABC transporter permease subunit [Paenibacillus rhizovicinus]QHW32482.1 sugar ABC transporter permease [Paenibacillus rhizovicinus]
MNLKFIDRLKAQWQLQAMVWPGILLMIIFSFIPMFGLIIAFQDYSPLDGFRNSEFVGLDNFKAFLGDSDFYNVLTNTIGISLLKLLIGFPLEIVLAILINELRTGPFKKFSQTVSYLPHFLSWVILGGMFITWLSSSGLVNSLLMALHLTNDPIPFLTNPNGYWWVATLSDIWKEVGWGTILYLAAMAGIDPSLYEAARVDGAKKLKQIRYITLPGISHIIVLMFVLRVGSVLGSNLEQALVLQNGSNIHRSEVIDLYVYHLGLTQGDFSFATAVGIFSSVVSVILLLGANFLTKRVNDSSIF